MDAIDGFINRGQSCDAIQRLDVHVRGALRVGRLHLTAREGARCVSDSRASDTAGRLMLRHGRSSLPRSSACATTAACRLKPPTFACRRTASLIAGPKALLPGQVFDHARVVACNDAVEERLLGPVPPICAPSGVGARCRRGPSHAPRPCGHDVHTTLDDDVKARADLMARSKDV